MGRRGIDERWTLISPVFTSKTAVGVGRAATLECWSAAETGLTVRIRFTKSIERRRFATTPTTKSIGSVVFAWLRTIATGVSGFVAIVTCWKTRAQGEERVWNSNEPRSFPERNGRSPPPEPEPEFEPNGREPKLGLAFSSLFVDPPPPPPFQRDGAGASKIERFRFWVFFFQRAKRIRKR